MQDSRPERAKRTTQESSAPSVARPRDTTRRTIDCGAAGDEGNVRIRQPDRGDVRHGYVTSRGIYADQAQAI